MHRDCFRLAKCILIFVHLNKGNTFDRNVTIVTTRGKEFEIDLDQMEFIVQRRAKMIYPHLSSLMEQGQKEQAKLVIAQTVDLIVNRLRRSPARILRSPGISCQACRIEDDG